MKEKGKFNDFLKHKKSFHNFIATACQPAAFLVNHQWLYDFKKKVNATKKKQKHSSNTIHTPINASKPDIHPYFEETEQRNAEAETTRFSKDIKSGERLNFLKNQSNN